MNSKHFVMRNELLITDFSKETSKSNASRFFMKLGKFALIFFITFTALFTFLYFIPQTPYYVEQLKESGASDEIINNAIEQFGLNQGFIGQYINSLTSLFTLNWGYSWTNGQAVLEYLWPKIVLTLEIGISAICFGLLFGIPLGVSVAKIKNPKLNAWLLFASALIYAIPIFIFGYLWFYLSFSLGLPTMFTMDSPYWIIVCGLLISIPLIFNYAKLVEEEHNNESNKVYVKAWNDRNGNKKFISKSVIKQSFYPLVNFIPTIAFTFTFASLTLGPIFGIPGLGNALVVATKELDRPVILALMSYYLVMVFASYLVREAILIGVYKNAK